jgi:hypothetical protein
MHNMIAHKRYSRHLPQVTYQDTSRNVFTLSEWNSWHVGGPTYLETHKDVFPGSFNPIACCHRGSLNEVACTIKAPYIKFQQFLANLDLKVEQ